MVVPVLNHEGAIALIGANDEKPYMKLIGALIKLEELAWQRLQAFCLIPSPAYLNVLLIKKREKTLQK
ncbi:hypothetical protein [Lyngbya confervoides]|uniref:IclR-ED domain-containing protein n=1 Tax=Lyngbya confervoides BDU141951 TaxID=1574623 RepID=A0ABD4T796_9CYAN|nr:hypothetical protein [Lyngbya confervoides]MCM1984375.1 hypothetical protein [Lyngbya confervoides BDU141951]